MFLLWISITVGCLHCILRCVLLIHTSSKLVPYLFKTQTNQLTNLTYCSIFASFWQQCYIYIWQSKLVYFPPHLSNVCALPGKASKMHLFTHSCIINARFRTDSAWFLQHCSLSTHTHAAVCLSKFCNS